MMPRLGSMRQFQTVKRNRGGISRMMAERWRIRQVRETRPNFVSKQTKYESLETLCRNHRERRRPLVEVSNGLSFEDSLQTWAIGGGSDDGHSSVPDVWH